MEKNIDRANALEDLREAILRCLENCVETGASEHMIRTTRRELDETAHRLMVLTLDEKSGVYRPDHAEAYWLSLVTEASAPDCCPTLLAD